MLTILQAETAEHISTARELIEEYAAWLEFKLCFQGFSRSLGFTVIDHICELPSGTCASFRTLLLTP